MNAVYEGNITQTPLYSDHRQFGSNRGAILLPVHNGEVPVFHCKIFLVPSTVDIFFDGP